MAKTLLLIFLALQIVACSGGSNGGSSNTTEVTESDDTTEPENPITNPVEEEPTPEPTPEVDPVVDPVTPPAELNVFTATEETANWNKFYDHLGQIDHINGMDTDADGNVYVIGSSNNLTFVDSGKDGWVKKFNAAGVEQTAFELKFDNAKGTDGGRDIIVDSEGKIYIAGIATNLFDGSSGKDVWVKKFNADGTEITTGWNKVISYGSKDNISALAVDANDNVFLLMKSEHLVNGTSGEDWWIQKFDKNGVEDSSWAGLDADVVAPIASGKVFDGNGAKDVVKSMTFDSNGNIYAAGRGENLVTSTSEQDAWIKKFSAAGVEDTAFEVQYDVEGVSNEITAVAVDSADSLFVGGFVNESGVTKYWLSKFDSAGNEDTTTWNIRSANQGIGYTKITDLVIDHKDRIYITGFDVDNSSGVSIGKPFVNSYGADGVKDTTYLNALFDHTSEAVTKEFKAQLALDRNGDLFAFISGYDLISDTSDWDWWLKKFDVEYVAE